MQHDKIFQLVESFDEAKINSYLLYATYRKLGEHLRYINGDSMTEVIKFKLDVPINSEKYAYIPIKLPVPSWFQFYDYYMCYVSPLPQQKKEVLQVNQMCCTHSVCLARIKNNFNKWLQDNMLKNCKYFCMVLIDEAFNKLPAKSINDKVFQENIKNLTNEFLKLVPAMKSEINTTKLVLEYPLKKLENIFKGFYFDCEGNLVFNKKFNNRFIVINQPNLVFELPFVNPFETREFCVKAVFSNNLINVIVSKHRVTLQAYESNTIDAIDAKDLSFAFNSTIDYTWDMDTYKMVILPFCIANFKNISYPKRNWTEKMCFLFFKLFGFVQFDSDSLSIHFKESLVRPHLYNTSKEFGVNNISISWSGEFEKEKLSEMIERFKNDRTFHVMGLVKNDQACERLVQVFNNFCEVIKGPMANLHDTQCFGSLDYSSFSSSIIDAMKDSISEKMFKCTSLVDNDMSKSHLNDLYLVPVFLKPSGLSINGFEAFVKSFTALGSTYEKLSIFDIKFFYYSAEIIEEFYPNCASRPYGQEWWNYLTSGQAALILFDASALYAEHNNVIQLIRDTCVTARIKSNIIWTRNICHCPDSENERIKNLLFIFKHFYNLD